MVIPCESLGQRCKLELETECCCLEKMNCCDERIRNEQVDSNTQSLRHQGLSILGIHTLEHLKTKANNLTGSHFELVVTCQ